MGVSNMNLSKTLLLVPLLVCSVTCSDGNKVDLFCEEGGVSISSTNNFAGGKSTVDAECGKKMKFKACFPFCGSDSPNQSPSKVPSTTNSRPHELELETELEPELGSELESELEP